MPNGSSHLGHYDPEARIAALDERVTGLRGSVTNLESVVARGFANVDAQITGLSSNLAERNKPNYLAISVGLVFLGLILTGVGALVWTPVNSRMMQLEEARSRLPDEFVPRRESEALRVRALEDRVQTSNQFAQINEALDELPQTYVARNEWMERNRARDTELADAARRINELRTDFGAIYGTRDVIQAQSEENRAQNEHIRRLEALIYQMVPQRSLGNGIGGMGG